MTKLEKTKKEQVEHIKKYGYDEETFKLFQDTIEFLARIDEIEKVNKKINQKRISPLIK